MSDAHDVQPLRFMSFGGGVQSTACLVLAVQGRIDFTDFVFANVGDDSEDPATLDYVRDWSRPYAEAHGLTIHEIHRVKRDGSQETLLQRMTREGGRSLPIPVRLSRGKPAKRSCTADFKVRVLAKWAKAHGASADNPATVAIGISVDEIQRANAWRAQPHERIVYPLLDLGLRRSDCYRIIADAGLPKPPKSACFFCPFHREHVWLDMKRDRPDLFEKSCQLEELLSSRRVDDGKGPVFMTDYEIPLRRLLPENVELLPLFDPEGECDSGYCFT